MPIKPQSQESLVADLRRIGLGGGDAVIVHSSLRSVGKVEGGAATVVRALLEVVGPRGLLMVPNFSYSCTYFDPAFEPSLTGVVTETVRRWPGAVRSLHPTHSVAAIGENAVEIVRGHHLMSAIALGSPLDRLAAMGGWVLLLGVGHTQNSTIHVGEIHADVPYKDVPFSPDLALERTVVTPEGERLVPIIHPPGCSKGFGAIEGNLRLGAAIRDGLVGNSLTQLMRGRNVIDTTFAMLTEEPGALLCFDPYCYRCTEARKICAGRTTR